MSRRAAAGVRAAIAVAIGCASSPVHAQAKNDAAAAEALFKEGKRLMGLGQASAACPKFAESQRLDPGIGTMLWLADCHSKNGQLASAWAVFHEAEALAAKQKDPRITIARDEAQRLEPRLSKLVIDVTDVSDISDLEIQRDGVSLGKPLWGTPIPTDGGTHTITASAIYRKTWQTRISVPLERGSVPVKIPHLEEERTEAPLPQVAPPRPAEDPVADPGRGRTQRVVGIAVAGVGLVGVALGRYFGLGVASKNDESSDHCDAASRCDATGFELRQDALRYATYADVSFIVGAAALVGGAVLFLTAPRPVPAAAGASPRSAGSTGVRWGVGPMSSAGGGALVQGRF
jgi:hypothetical protein